MSKTKQPKRRKVWVSFLLHQPHDVQVKKFHESETDDQGRFVELHPGDALLSREDAEELAEIVAAIVSEREYPLHYGRLLALLRGRR